MYTIIRKSKLNDLKEELAEAKFALERAKKDIESLKYKYTEARDLRSVIDMLVDKTVQNTMAFDTYLPVPELSDDVAVYVHDLLDPEKKVIKQEANKCIVIDEDGKVTEGLTKSDVDSGYTYKLIRNDSWGKSNV